VSDVRLGLRANAAQFSLLVGLNALVGAMVGLERSVLPLVGERDFQLSSHTAILWFVVAFGIWHDRAAARIRPRGHSRPRRARALPRRLRMSTVE
jgi:hypothetical protein